MLQRTASARQTTSSAGWRAWGPVRCPRRGLAYPGRRSVTGECPYAAISHSLNNLTNINARRTNQKQCASVVEHSVAMKVHPDPPLDGWRCFDNSHTNEFLVGCQIIWHGYNKRFTKVVTNDFRRFSLCWMYVTEKTYFLSPTLRRNYRPKTLF